MCICVWVCVCVCVCVCGCVSRSSSVSLCMIHVGQNGDMRKPKACHNVAVNRSLQESGSKSENKD